MKFKNGEYQNIFEEFFWIFLSNIFEKFSIFPITSQILSDEF